jgi:hypothetical protein
MSPHYIGVPASMAILQANHPSARTILATRTTPEFIQQRYNLTIAAAQNNNIQVCHTETRDTRHET